MTTIEFENRLKNKDIVCMLANMLAELSPLHTKLKYAKPSIIDNYIEKAITMLEQFNKFDLKITINE